MDRRRLRKPLECYKNVMMSIELVFLFSLNTAIFVDSRRPKPEKAREAAEKAFEAAVAEVVYDFHILWHTSLLLTLEL